MENITRSQFVCARCSKSFETETTYKRHGYYCRSRQASQRNSRKRSCAACTKAKTRCDSKHPTCSTCIARCITCQYSKETSQGNKASQPHTSVASTRAKDVVFCDSLSMPSTADEEMPSNELSYEQLDILSPRMTEGSRPYEAYLHAQKDLAAFSMSDSNVNPFDWVYDSSTGLGFNPSLGASFSFSSMPQLYETPVTLSQRGSNSIPPSPSESLITRSLAPRSLGKTGAQISALLLTRILSAYPAMMMRKETFPPFIHPVCFTDYGEIKGSFPEALVNCITIARMFVNRGKEPTKFMWRTIRMEQERMWFEYHDFDNWELLASAQALMIYTLMRMIEGPNEDNDFDAPLLLSLNVVSSTLSERFGGDELKQAPSGDQQDWQEWIFHESWRRPVTTHTKAIEKKNRFADKRENRMDTFARILNMLIDIDTAVSCSPLQGFIMCPLPTKKVLWEARDASSWRVEFDATLKERELFGVSTDGQLTKMQIGSGGISTTASDWGKWYAEMDSFGTLIMIAASLL